MNFDYYDYVVYGGTIVTSCLFWWLSGFLCRWMDKMEALLATVVIFVTIAIAVLEIAWLR